jgi:hypothetical protein
MKKIISDIHNAIQNSRKTIEFLKKNSTWTWVGDYPIAIVNEITRVKDEESLKKLHAISFFDAKGFSKSSYTKEEINYLTENVPSSLKRAYCLCLKKKSTDDYNFVEKFQYDRWKKVTYDDNFEALVESSKFIDTDNSQSIETELRDIMRSRKEIPSLKAIGFVWIVTLPITTEIEDILNHYFLDNHIFIEKGRKIVYIAWANKLADVNMRYFVNAPLPSGK